MSSSFFESLLLCIGVAILKFSVVSLSTSLLFSFS